METFTVDGFSAARRPAPRLEAVRIGRIPRGMKVQMEKWTTGEAINGNDVWYGDGTGWVWSGSFVEPVDTWGLRRA